MRRLEDFYAGSVSDGTLLPEQIAQNLLIFLDNKPLDADLKEELETIKKEMSEFMDLETFELYDDDHTAEFSALVFKDLFDFMENIAPHNTSFGAHMNDGTDFGFWAWNDYDDNVEFGDLYYEE